MTPGARLSAAIEVIADIEARRRPAADALKDWGLVHRFAGSADRAAIAGLVYDTLRRRASSAHIMGDQRPRAAVLGMLRLERKLDCDAIAARADGGRFAPPPLSAEERARLAAADLAGAPPWVAGDYPQWLDPHLARVFGEERIAEGEALASRAPLDLRVNGLKAEPEAARDALAHLNAVPTRWSPVGLRIALAAVMENRGQLYATDSDKRRLAPIHERLERAGVHNVQVRTPRARENLLADLENRADLVLIDAPCTGIGTWRRNPDAKWRVRPGALELRLEEQIDALDRAAVLVKPGGRIAYVTCSVLAEENGDQVRAFLARQPDFALVPVDVANALGERAYLFRRAALTSEEGLLMTPRRTDTDGFYVALLVRRGRAA